MGQGGDGDSQICPTMRLEIRSSEFTSASSLAATATTIVCSRRLGGGGAEVNLVLIVISSNEETNSPEKEEERQHQKKAITPSVKSKATSKPSERCVRWDIYKAGCGDGEYPKVGCVHTFENISAGSLMKAKSDENQMLIQLFFFTAQE
nr:hypothetical protein Iba_chr02eCG7540 [Ipomoea batatas]